MFKLNHQPTKPIQLTPQLTDSYTNYLSQQYLKEQTYYTINFVAHDYWYEHNCTLVIIASELTDFLGDTTIQMSSISPASQDAYETFWSPVQ